MEEQRSPKPPVVGSSPAAPAIAEVVESGRHAILRGWWAYARRSSNLLLGTMNALASGSSSAVERLLAKEEVASSNLVFRSIRILWRRSQVARRGSAKPLFTGSNPVAASILHAEVAEWQTRRT